MVCKSLPNINLLLTVFSNDLRNYVPSGKLEPAEVLNKMSLYLLAQLSYGVTLVLSVQADFLIGNQILNKKNIFWFRRFAFASQEHASHSTGRTRAG